MKVFKGTFMKRDFKWQKNVKINVKIKAKIAILRKCFSILIMLLLIFINCSEIYAKENETYSINNDIESNAELPDKELYSKAVALIDADSGRLLYGKNENEVLPMASTTKILTCIIALESADLNEIVTVSSNAEKMPKVKLYIKEGEKYLLKDLLYSLMLESHNDSAVAIAEHISGNVQDFAKLMNRKAKEIGCENSYFITPNGLDATENNQDNGVKKIHSTTAYELAKIMAYCVQKSYAKDEFLEITRTSNYSFSDNDKKRSFSCNNHNAFLNMLDGALSGKTGFTNNAGYCYVGALRRDERTFVVALLACGWPNNKGYKWKDTLKLMNYAIDNYQSVNIEKKQIEKIEIPRGIDYSDNKEKNPYKTAYIELAEVGEDNKKILVKKDEKIVRRYEIKENLKAPILSGEKIGKVTYFIENGMSQEQIYENAIVVQNTVEKKGYNIYLDFIINSFLL